MNTLLRLSAGLSVAFALSACAPTVSSTVADGANAEPAYEGKVLVSQAPLPGDVQHKVIGTVNAQAQSGYGGVETLYPLLAEEARKLGANGVINVSGGRKVAAASWSAPYASGTAIKVENPDDLGGIQGQNY